MERGHQLAKYLSCCAASQCAETHVCSRKVAKAGAAACKDCGGAGGGSEWAKAFAVALCEIFDCPASVQLEALGLVLAAVTVAAPPSPSPYPSPGNPPPLEDGPPRSDPYLPHPELDAGDREGCDSEGEASGLGSSWESVSSFTGLDIEATYRGGDGEFDDDEAVKKGIWFPPPLPDDGDDDDDGSLEEPQLRPPAVADGHSCSSSFDTNGNNYVRSSTEGGVSSIPLRSGCDGGDGITVLPLETETVAKSSTSTDGGTSFRERGATSSEYENEGVRCFREALDDVEEDRDEQSEKPEEEGSEFVLLVSREATVKELAARVRGFPQNWLEEAFGLVVRRQVEGAVYDARARAALKRAVKMLDGRLSWSQVAVTEQELAALALDHDMRIQDGDKVGLAAAGGGVLLFLSGGVAAPSVTASLSAVGLGAWLGYTSASASVAATTVGSFGAISAVSGAAGAGVAGYKMTRRTAGVQEFHFLPLHSKWPLDAPESMFEGASEPGLPVFICIPGWHEPGHDPRHTWGGVATRGEASDHPRVRRARSSSVEQEDAAVEKGAAPPRQPTAQTTVTREATDRWQSVQAAVTGGSAVSRWFSTAPAAASSETRESKEGTRLAVPLLSSMLTRSTVSGVVAPSFRGTVNGMHRETVHGTDGERVNGNDRGIIHGLEWEPVSGTFYGSVRGTVHGTLYRTEREAGNYECSARDKGFHSTKQGGNGQCYGYGESPAAAAAAAVGPTRVNDDGRSLPRVPTAAAAALSPPMASSFVVLGAGGRGGEGDGARVSGYALHGDASRDEYGDAISPGELEEETEEGDALDGSWEALPSHAWWRDFVRGGEEHVLVWERGPLTELYTAIRDLAWKSASRRAVKQALKRSALAPVVAAAALPLALLEAASGLDDPWGIVRSRALEAGRLLAAVLLSRPVGSRPVTLLGYSMGAKVVFNCLEALAAAPGDRGLGIVENAVMLGTPVGTKRGRWKRARSAVAGRLINGYSSRDWLLALVYRSKSWSVGVAGTSRVEGCGVENVDLSGLVTWHLSYSRILPVVIAMLRLEQ